MQRLWIHLVWVGLLLSTSALANPKHPGQVVEIRPDQASPIDAIPNIIFLNRCTGGCTIKGSNTTDARTHTSTIPAAGVTFTMTAFAWGDTEWNALLQCMKEVYSPYGV